MENAVKRQLEKIVGTRYVIDSSQVEFYAYLAGDATMYRAHPTYVVYPANAEEISRVVKLAGDNFVPVVPGGGMTGLSGGAICQGGILLNCSRMNRVLDIDLINRTVTAQPGIPCAELNAALAKHGAIVPVAPASHEISSLGGNLAESAGGTFGMSKGTFRNYLLSLEVVDGLGRIFRTGAPTMKESVGPDLTGLFIGNEGTLGVITEVTLRWEFLPEDVWTIRSIFKDESVLHSIYERIAEERLSLYSFEYMDPAMMRCLGKEKMLLLLQTAGSKSDAEASAMKMVEILRSLDPEELAYSNDPAEADELYKDRRLCVGALAKANRAKPVIVQFDPVLPLHLLAEGARVMRQLAEESGLDIIIYGHAGDGNLHPTFIIADKLEQKLKAREMVRKFDVWAEEHGGCYAGEHAVGFFLGRSQEEIRPEVGPYLKGIKDTFDPKGILNPGKVINTFEPSLETDPVLPGFEKMAEIVGLCSKCHLCKNNSPKFAETRMEHDSIRGRIAMLDAACRGWVSLDKIRPYIAECAPWMEGMNCPTWFKEEYPRLLDLALSS